MKSRLKGLLALTLSLVMMLSMVTVGWGSVNAQGIHVCDTADCLVCDVADKINALPDAADITVNNAAAVTEQIHAIDRIKFDLDDDEYEELLTLVDSANYAPTRYFAAVDAIKSLNDGASFYIAKDFLSDNGTVNTSDATVQFKITNVNTSATQTLTLATIPYQTNALSSDADFYSANTDGSGWKYKYILPAGTYRIEEVSDSGATVNGAPFVTGSTTYSVDGTTTTDYAVVTVENGGSSVVSVLNSYGASVQVSEKVILPGTYWKYDNTTSAWTIGLEDDYNVHFASDGDGGTLTLNNFTYSGDKIGISATEDLTIKLIGENNTITTTSDKGISVSGNLTIEGSNDKVTATGVKYGIYANSITIKGGTVTATGGGNDGRGIYTKQGNVTISGGTVTATGETYGIFADKGYYSGGMKVTISGGAVTANAGDNGGIGIYARDGEIAISGTNTEVTVGCATGLKASTVNILENSTVTITTNATAPAVGKAIDATTLNFGGNWYQWSTNNPGETTPISSATKAFALNNYGGTGQNPVPTSLTVGKITYTVTFDANGHGTAPTAQTVASGATASEPTAPTADGWTFGGWYKEAGCSNAFDFNTAITGNITLYAKWTENSGGVPGNQQPSYNYPIYIPPVEEEPEVTAPNTFDGGIASAVVVTILSATGGAWLAKKKD